MTIQRCAADIFVCMTRRARRRPLTFGGPFCSTALIRNCRLKASGSPRTKRPSRREAFTASFGRAYGYGLAPLLCLDDPHRDALALRQIRQLCPLHDRDMYEDILAAVVDFDETHAFLEREPFDGPKHVDGSR